MRLVTSCVRLACDVELLSNSRPHVLYRLVEYGLSTTLPLVGLWQDLAIIFAVQERCHAVQLKVQRPRQLSLRSPLVESDRSSTAAFKSGPMPLRIEATSARRSIGVTSEIDRKWMKQAGIYRD